MSALTDQRCWNHSSRQAVVRCPECRRFYCRECVTEHRGRMMCAGCVAAISVAVAESKNKGTARWIALASVGLLLAWVTFYYMGVLLARVPSTFFE